ncbi:MAG: DUF4386 family protein [Mobilicoccus sp.]|nr:DUF4386 family protein [Mobilicoccus sp.]
MAILAPVAVFWAIPRGSLGLAGALVVVVAALDVIVSLALYPLIGAAGRALATTISGLRLVYAVVFAWAGAHLLMGDAERFQRIWDGALLLFGLHMLLLGLAMIRIPAMPSWIGILVIIAGGGYLIDSVLTLSGLEQIDVSSFTFVGEVVLLVWLLGWAERPSAQRGRARSTSASRSPAT